MPGGGRAKPAGFSRGAGASGLAAPPRMAAPRTAGSRADAEARLEARATLLRGAITHSYLRGRELEGSLRVARRSSVTSPVVASVVDLDPSSRTQCLSRAAHQHEDRHHANHAQL